MKKFLLQSFYFIILTASLLELGSRLMMDKTYFYAIDPYKGPSALTDVSIADIYKSSPSSVDYLFIGSSRVAAGINSDQWNSIHREDNITINAGRGFFSGGSHYLALSNLLDNYPDYLKGAKVYLELPGGVIYAENFDDHLYDYYPSMSHLVLPHVSFSNFRELVARQNTLSDKANITLLYFSSFYRTFPFFKEYKGRFIDRLVKSRIQTQPKSDLANAGGIKVNSSELSQAKERALRMTEDRIKYQDEQEILTLDQLNNSIVAHLATLIRENGGEMILFEMPLHSSFQKVNQTSWARENSKVFKSWVDQEGIRIIDTSEFDISDDDFPDYWHMSITKRAEFTSFMAQRDTSDHAPSPNY
ncbi:MAG: hypothetical protein ABJF11_17385 [Reichenbachiella sp.]|uniref:hypothetical protein n=1 Tax=Reichenbachiella sp. TaxID=2184521 RepID=UPI003266383D